MGSIRTCPYIPSPASTLYLLALVRPPSTTVQPQDVPRHRSLQAPGPPDPVLRPSSAGLLDHNAGATLMPKYAELLANRRGNEHTDSSRGMTTTHRPTPQPSIANRSKPLMQTFTSSSTRHAPSTNIDATVLPSFASLHTVSSSAGDPIVPILPDNYSVRVAKNEEPIVTEPEVKIVAADPDKVVAGTPLSQVQGVI